MGRVGGVPPLNDVVQPHGLLGEAVIPSHHLVEFPSVEAFVPAEEAAGLSRRPDEFCTAHRTENVDHEFVEVRAVGGFPLRNALADVLTSPSRCFLADFFPVCVLCHASHSINHGRPPSAVRGRMPSSSRTHVSSVPTLPSP